MIRGNMTKPFHAVGALLMALAALSDGAHAADKLYVGGPGTGSWATSSNWSPAGAPGISDTATISPSDTAARTVVYSTAPGSFTFNHGTISVRSNGGSVTLLNRGGVLFTSGMRLVNPLSTYTQTFENQAPRTSISNLTMDGGMLRANSGTLTLNTVTHNSGTLIASAITLNGHYALLGGKLGSLFETTNLVNNGVMDFNGGQAEGQAFTNNGTFNYNTSGPPESFMMTIMNFGAFNLNANGRIFGLVNHVPVTLPAGRTLMAELIHLESSTLTQSGNAHVFGGVAVKSPSATWDQRPGTTTTASFVTIAFGRYLFAPSTSLTAHSMELSEGGRFEQSGGSITLGIEFQSVGSLVINNGVYSMTAGTVKAGTFSIGPNPASSFVQTGGVAQFTAATLLTAGGGAPRLSIGGGLFEVTSSTAPMRNDGSITQTGGQSRFFRIEGTGSIGVGGNALLTCTNLRQDALRLSGSARVIVSATPAPVPSILKSLSFDQAGGTVHGTLDIGETPLVIDYSASSSIADIRRYLRSGYAGGNWSGPGLISWRAQLYPESTALGYIEAGELLGAGGGLFEGATVDGTAVLVRLTRAGDADLDGDADGIDIGAWAQNFTGELGGAGTSVWSDGDWDYDGDVDGVDAGLWAQNFTGELGGGNVTLTLHHIDPRATKVLESLGVNVVPETATAGGILTILAGLSQRRRKTA